MAHDHVPECKTQQLPNSERAIPMRLSMDQPARAAPIYTCFGDLLTACESRLGTDWATKTAYPACHGTSHLPYPFSINFLTCDKSLIIHAVVSYGSISHPH